MASDLYSLLNMNKTDDDEDVLKTQRMSSMESAPVDDNTDWNKAAQEAWDANEREKAVKASAGVAATRNEVPTRSIESPQVAQGGGSEAADEIANYGTPINVSGDHTAKVSPSPAPVVDTKEVQTTQKSYTANTDPEHKAKGDMESLAPWLATLAPYAIEGIFGGGKYMGSAGYGSAEGGKIIRELEKQRADRDVASMKVTSQLTKALNDLGFKREKLASDKDTQEDRTAIMQQNADTSKAKQAEGNYTFVKSVDANGNPVYSAMDKKTANVLPTDTKVYVPPQNKIQSGYLGQRQLEADMRFKQNALKATQPLIEAKQSIDNVRDRIAKSPGFFQNATNPTANSPEAQLDKAAIDKMLNTEIFLKGGKTLTENEKRMVAGPSGVVPFGDLNNITGVKTWLSSNPDNVKKFIQLMEGRYRDQWNQIQRANTTITGKNYAKDVGGGGLDLGEAPPPAGTVKKAAPVKKETPDEQIARIKKQLGYK